MTNTMPMAVKCMSRKIIVDARQGDIKKARASIHLGFEADPQGFEP